MTIHHNTLAKATRKGILMVEANGKVHCHIVHAAEGRDDSVGTIEVHENAKIALRLAMQANGTTECALLDADTTSQDDLANEWAELDADAVTEDDDTEEAEDEPGKTIVEPKYRAKYAERGNPNNCGDTVAKLLDGKFDLNDEDQRAEYFAMLADNGVEQGKWAAQVGGSLGWQGRVKMSGNRALRKAIEVNGKFDLNGKTYTL